MTINILDYRHKEKNGMTCIEDFSTTYNNHSMTGIFTSRRKHKLYKSVIDDFQGYLSLEIRKLKLGYYESAYILAQKGHLLEIDRRLSLDVSDVEKAMDSLYHLGAYSENLSITEAQIRNRLGLETIDSDIVERIVACSDKAKTKKISLNTKHSSVFMNIRKPESLNFGSLNVETDEPFRKRIGKIFYVPFSYLALYFALPVSISGPFWRNIEWLDAIDGYIAPSVGRQGISALLMGLAVTIMSYSGDAKRFINTNESNSRIWLVLSFLTSITFCSYAFFEVSVGKGGAWIGDVVVAAALAFGARIAVRENKFPSQRRSRLDSFFNQFKAYGHSLVRKKAGEVRDPPEGIVPVEAKTLDLPAAADALGPRS